MAAPNMDQFESYFRRADLDQDGRISGGEAVSFFQGSGLPKQVLAQIWTYADQKRAGFLDRLEFFNALKLVTVAQSKRDLTPDIVKAALYGPASARIPAPQINFPATPLPQSTPSSPQLGPRGAAATQNLGFRGQMAPNANMSQQYIPSHGNQLTRPPQTIPVGHSRPPQGVQSLPTSGVSADWLNGRTGVGLSGPTSQVPNRGMSPSSPSVSSVIPDLSLTVVQPAVKDSNPSATSRNGPAAGSTIAGDPFSTLQPGSKSGHSPLTYTASSAPVSSAIVPMSTAPQSSPQVSSVPSSFDSLQSAIMKQPVGGQSKQVQTSPSTTQPVSQVNSSVVSTGVSAVGNLASNQSQHSWPKMTTAGIQKYTKVFMEVDTDRDGKITGEQARSLFLSWRLPREVLKQVWDLSDQDNDSMLSLREFCLALYLMERYREGSPLPASLPNSMLFDETLMRMTGLPNASYGNAAWGSAPGQAPIVAPGTGFRQMQGVPASQPTAPVTGLRPPLAVNSHQADGAKQYVQNARSFVLDKSQANQVSEAEQSSLQPEAQTANDSKKVERAILDSKEKMEFYRNKMQELVLYKSRCDNRLNEIIERASADKREAEFQGKKYEEKYKQVAEIVSKLTVEDAAFREYQERKKELTDAIANVEQGGSADGILQVRADRIQMDLEGLVKVLSERCKKHGIEFKSATLIELPTGWQPGVPEGAAVWNEEWDKFDDEGLEFDREFRTDDENATAAAKSEPNLFNAEADFLYDGFSPDSQSYTESHKHFGRAEYGSESGYNRSEDGSGRSPSRSPTHRTSPSQDFSDIFKSSEADMDFQRSFDDQGWGNFDNTDDTDSVWGFNPSKDSSHEHLDSGGGFGLSPVRTGTPPGGGAYKKSSIFADSVPGSPFSRAGGVNSPRYSEAGDNLFDNYSTRFDSFSVSDGQFSPPREAFKKFDSVSSSRGDAFARFDSINSSRGETFARFDSINSSKGEAFGKGFSSFDDADPFGSSDPFTVSGATPRKGSENWNSF